MMNDLSCFLGANTFRGFHSLYEDFISAAAPQRLFILKGGAGCGKSGFLRRVAAAAAEQGLETEQILCSGDPDSLDGVWIPSRGLALFDGTAPHVLEPPQVGRVGFYLDLSACYRPGVPPLLALERAYREYYRRAYRYLAAAGSVGEITSVPDGAREAIRRRAAALVLRELKQKRREPGRVLRCFTDAFTAQGSITLSGTRQAICPRLIALSGGRDAAHLFLRSVLETASGRGYDAVVCPDPLEPDRLAHVLLPQAGLGFTTGTGSRKIHLEKLLTASEPEEDRRLRKEVQAQQDSLLQKARRELSLAKLSHDRLEDAVHACVDFGAVAEMADAFIARELPG